MDYITYSMLIMGILIIMLTLAIPLIYLVLISFIKTRDMNKKIAKKNGDLIRTSCELRNALHQRDLLLKEVYHRVKNNMQVLDSILSLESRKLTTDNQQTKDMICLLRNRISALGLVHTQLMLSNDLKYFDSAPFIQQLGEHLHEAMASENGIEIETHADNIKITLDFAIPLGLIITQLVTEEFKHELKTIYVIFRRTENNIQLMVSNGSKEVDSPKSRHGCKILNSLIRQLDGHSTRYQTESELCSEHEKLANTWTKIVMPLPQSEKIS